MAHPGSVNALLPAMLAYVLRSQNEHIYVYIYTGELGYDGPLYDRFLHMTDDMLGPSPMHIMYSSYVYDGFCI